MQNATRKGLNAWMVKYQHSRRLFPDLGPGALPLTPIEGSTS